VARHGWDLLLTVVPPAEAAGAAGATDAQNALRAGGRSSRTRFLFATIFTVPLFLLTMVVRHIPAAHKRLRKNVTDAAALSLVDVFVWALATPVQFLAAAGFYQGAYFAAKKGRSAMNTLITLGTSIAYGFSVIIVVLNVVRSVRGDEGGGDSVAPPTEATVFETAAPLVTVVFFGKWLEALARGRAAAGVAALGRLTPQTATVFVRRRRHRPRQGRARRGPATGRYGRRQARHGLSRRREEGRPAGRRRERRRRRQLRADHCRR